jgi:TatD DNase family protein
MSAGGSPVLADTHCHLDFQAFDDDREEVLARARQAGLVRILIPGIDLPSSKAALGLAENHAGLYAAVGIHPNEAASPQAGTIEEVRKFLAQPAAGGIAPERSKMQPTATGAAKIVAIGEVGLDYHRDRTPHALQRQVFLAQLELAAELSLPVVIHNREAAADLLAILADWQDGLVSSGSPLAARPGVLHSFSGELQTAQRAIDLHFYIGITGPVTFHNAPDLQQVVAALPLDRLLVETDAPFLAPHPFRGKRNEPAHVSLVAAKIASIQNLPFLQVAEATTANAGRLFQW